MNPEAGRVQALLRGYTATQLIYVGVRLGLFEQLQEHPESAAALAERLSCDPPALLRLLRGLAAQGLLADCGEGRFVATEAGKLLREGEAGDLRGWALLTGELFYPARAGLLSAVQKGQSAFESQFGTDFFSWISLKPELRHAFDSGMGRQTEALAGRLAALIGEQEQIVDLGGGQGTLLRTVLRQRPDCRGILFDRAAALAKAPKLLEEAGLQDRCTLQEGSFFEDLPEGGSSYVLSWILHDWSDTDCLRILKQVRKVLRPEARLLILEAVLPERVAGPSPVLESDLAMLVLLGGQERSEAEFAELLQAAGLRLWRRIELGLDRCVLEARIAEDGYIAELPPG